MSYILEALRRSQAERERGQVPGLNAQPSAVAGLPTRPEGSALPWWLLAGVAVLAAAALLVWFWRAPSATPAAPAVAAAPAPAPMPAPAMPGPTPLPMVVSAPPAAAVTTTAAPARPAPAPAAATAPTTPTLSTAPPAAAPTPASTLRTVRLADLSAEQRRELPPLSMGGSVWSESALSRFVIVNGQVVREGDTAAPGVVVDRIGPKAVWLRWRELRLEVAI